jgi:hypothetical protein
MKLIPLSHIGNVHQVKLIPAGKSDTVFYLRIPKGYFAFIDQVANTYFPNCFYEWIIDHDSIEKVEREIAPLNSPKEFNPPFVAKTFIKWEGYNENSEDHLFEVLNNGYLVKYG